MTLPIPGDGRWRLPLAVLACATLAVAVAARAQETDAEQGGGARRIVEFIAELEGRGITVIYGSDLLSDSLLMPEESGDDRGLASLEEALREHGLTLQPGPRDTWLVVRAREVAPAEPATAPPAVTPRPSFAPPPLESVIVSASRYAFSRATGPSMALLDRTELVDAPTLGGDAIRATHGLPGLTSSGLTARVNVRGGDADESLLFVDGVRLFSPFHLKDFQSLFSSINPQIVDTMSVFTGAYPAEYGDRMSAVMDIRTIVPEQERLYEVGVSTLTTSLLGAGRFAAGRGAWLGSIRRGNLDLLIDAAQSDIGTPRYVDAFGKLRYDVSERFAVTGGLLVLNDKISLNDVGIATARGDYRDSYLWAAADYASEKLDFETLVSVTDLSTTRSGTVDDPVGSRGMLEGSKDFESYALRVIWTYAFNDTHWLRGGLELRDSDAEYDFRSNRVDRVPIVTTGLSRPPDVTDALIGLQRQQQAAYLTYRARAGEVLTTELGIRWDEQSLPADSQLSPRINVLYDVGDRLSVRASWGRYFQSHGLDELKIGDGVTMLYPVQESEHTVLGIEYLFPEAISLRIEAYRKEFERLRPRFENLFRRVSLLPELEPDRVMLAPVSGEASGVEVSIEGGRGPWRWWTNVSRSRTSDVLGGLRADRSWAEPWSTKAGMLWTGPRWTVSLAATWHTGWPISELLLDDGRLVAGTFNAKRLESFRSIDVRASRRVDLRRGEFEWFVELNNALDSKNPCCFDYDVAFDAAMQPVRLDIYTDEWMPVIPSFGFVWRLERE